MSACPVVVVVVPRSSILLQQACFPVAMPDTLFKNPTLSNMAGVADQGRPGVRQRRAGGRPGEGLHAGKRLPLSASCRSTKLWELASCLRTLFYHVAIVQAKAGQAYDSAAQGAAQAKDYTQVKLLLS